MLVMAAAFALPALSGVVGPIALVFTILYVFSFALGTGPVPGLLSAELLPVSIRGMVPRCWCFLCTQVDINGSSSHCCSLTHMVCCGEHCRHNI